MWRGLGRIGGTSETKTSSLGPEFWSLNVRHFYQQATTVDPVRSQCVYTGSIVGQEGYHII